MTVGMELGPVVVTRLLARGEVHKLVIALSPMGVRARLRIQLVISRSQSRMMRRVGT